MEIISGLNLKKLTTFRIGGNARFFCIVKNIDDLNNALQFAKKEGVPIFVLGGGSNILVSDDGFPGLVIKMEIMGIKYLKYSDQDDDKVIVNVGAGENWDYFVGDTVDRDLYGIENLSYIPGTVGASPVQNIGAYGSEVKDTIHSVLAFDTKDGEIKEILNKDCRFSYRDSLFKKEKGRYIIIEVNFILNKKGKLNIEYRDVKDYLQNNKIENPSLKQIRDTVINIRKNKLPDVYKIGTAGSFFKNPIITKEKAEEMKLKWSDLPIYPFNNESVKISLAWILDKVCGYKGVEKGNVGTYKNQALVLINKGEATAEEIISFADEIVKIVKDKTGIDIEKEVEWVGKL